MNAKQQAKMAREMSLGLVNEVNAVLLATAVAEVERERIGAIRAKILADGDYRDAKGNRIVEPAKDWMMADDAFPAYIALVEASDPDRPGDLEPGYCPALIAETVRINAENDMIVAAGKWFPVFVDGDCPRVWGENRTKLVKLLMGMVVNFPGYKAPNLKGL